jgi:hypothetical protein
VRGHARRYRALLDENWQTTDWRPRQAKGPAQFVKARVVDPTQTPQDHRAETRESDLPAAAMAGKLYVHWGEPDQLWEVIGFVHKPEHAIVVAVHREYTVFSVEPTEDRCEFTGYSGQCHDAKRISSFRDL